MYVTVLKQEKNGWVMYEANRNPNTNFIAQ